jgi:hypothetical protein
MVKNIRRNAFATGLQDKRDMRPLESPEIEQSTPVVEPQAGQSMQEPTAMVQPQAPMESQNIPTAVQTPVQPVVAQSMPHNVEPTQAVQQQPQPATAIQPETHQPPKEKRIGSNVTVENWRAWKMRSIEYGTKQAVLLNAAMDYCFQQGHFDQSLIDKYEQKD